jgi:GTP-binding protein
MAGARPSAAAIRKLFASPCNFVFGTSDISQMPPARLPEIAFAGRSNVGKSSLVNALTNRRALARVSRTPGRTQQINFFELANALLIADLPGYGYARAPGPLRDTWQQLVRDYLKARPNLRRVFLLVDGRRGLMDQDRSAMALLDESAVSFALVLTKSDKLSEAETGDVIRALETEGKGHSAAWPGVIATSAAKGLGLEPLKRQIAALVH